MIEAHMQPVQRIGQCIKATAKVYRVGMGQR
nr:MAG TPA: hypothetical protein [Caudoviricetes sp.]